MVKRDKLRKVVIFIAGALIVGAAVPGFCDNRKTLVICDDITDLATMDPYHQYTEKNRGILQQVYEELIRINAEGKFEPILAESWERINPLTVRFHLRPNISFHNGEPFNADAVDFSVHRALNPATQFPGLPFISSISSATVVNPLTVDIHTHFPDGLLLHRLGIALLITPPKYIREKGEMSLQDTPIGTGPFIFDRWDKGRQIVLKANPQYWRPGLPKVKELKYLFLQNEKQQEEFFAGRVDFMTEMPGTLTLKAKENPHTDVMKRDTLYTVVGHFNTSKGPLSNRMVRQAMNHAIDRLEIIRFDVLGNGRELASMTMPGEIGHNAGLKPYRFNIGLAKDLMKKAGYPDGFQMKAIARFHGARTAGIIAKQLEKIGITVSVTVAASDLDVMSALQKGDWDMGIAALPDPMAHSFFIQSLVLYSRSPFSLHHDPGYDKKMEQMVSELDPEKQDKLGQELDKYIFDEALCLFTFQRIRTYGVSRRLRFRPSITGNNYFETADLVGSRP